MSDDNLCQFPQEWWEVEIERLTARLEEFESVCIEREADCVEFDAKNWQLTARNAELEADLFAAELKARTFEQGYDESQEARRYLEQALAKLQEKDDE